MIDDLSLRRSLITVAGKYLYWEDPVAVVSSSNCTTFNVVQPRPFKTEVQGCTGKVEVALLSSKKNTFYTY